MTQTLSSARGLASRLAPVVDGSRCVDLAVALAALVLLAPLMVVVALTVWAHDGGPPIYGQERLGRYGRPFLCLKFRSMPVGAAERLREILAADAVSRAEWMRDRKLRNDPRLTGLGALLRRSSLDELPQLFNVLKGEMGVVGPRPIVSSEIPRYRRYYKDYCTVRPGITGLWQVSGRNNVSYRRRVALDVAYIRSRSLALDLRLIAAT